MASHACVKIGKISIQANRNYGLRLAWIELLPILPSYHARSHRDDRLDVKQTHTRRSGFYPHLFKALLNVINYTSFILAGFFFLVVDPTQFSIICELGFPLLDTRMKAPYKSAEVSRSVHRFLVPILYQVYTSPFSGHSLARAFCFRTFSTKKSV